MLKRTGQHGYDTKCSGIDGACARDSSGYGTRTINTTDKELKLIV
jgi:hypothetical protein